MSKNISSKMLLYHLQHFVFNMCAITPSELIVMFM